MVTDLDYEATIFTNQYAAKKEKEEKKIAGVIKEWKRGFKERLSFGGFDEGLGGRRDGRWELQLGARGPRELHRYLTYHVPT